MTAKCMQHTGTSIVCRTAADSNDKIPAPLIQRMADKFPHTVGCRFHRIARLWRNKRKPGGLRHLDHSCLIRQNSIGCLHLLTKRTSNRNRHIFSLKTGYQSSHSSFSAVCHWPDGYSCVRQRTENSLFCGCACLKGAKAAFKRINCYNNIHKDSF